MSPALESFDVVVIGGGPAGIAAGVAAAERRARVLVIDEGLGPGGQIWRPSRIVRPPVRARNWVARLEASSAVIARSSSVIDLQRFGSNAFVIRIESTEGARDVLAARVVLATGARELFLPFPGWTLPNVFGIGGVQALLKTGAVFRGRRVVIAGSGPLLLPVAASLKSVGARLLLVAEQAPFAQIARYTTSLWRKPTTLIQAAVYRSRFLGAPYRVGTWVTSATGDGTLCEVVVSNGTTSRTIECDVLCTGFGLVPNVELARLLGCSVERGSVVVDDRQQTSVSDVYAAGEPTGIGGVDLALVEGEIAGSSAASGDVDVRLVAARSVLVRGATMLATVFQPREEVRRLATPETIVCRCEDVRRGALDASWSARQAKLSTRAGMGPCQGRVCGAALECIMGWPSDSVRPPTQPARLSTLLLESQHAASSSAE